MTEKKELKKQKRPRTTNKKKIIIQTRSKPDTLHSILLYSWTTSENLYFHISTHTQWVKWTTQKFNFKLFDGRTFLYFSSSYRDFLFIFHFCVIYFPFSLIISPTPSHIHHESSDSVYLVNRQYYRKWLCEFSEKTFSSMSHIFVYRKEICCMRGVVTLGCTTVIQTIYRVSHLWKCILCIRYV